MFSYRNQFGSIDIKLDKNIMTAEFKGAISESIAKYFIKSAKILIQEIDYQYWGYVSYSEQADAATPDAFNILLEAGPLFHQAGCRKYAYVLKSAIAIAQMEKIRLAVGETGAIKDVLFDDINQAEKHVSNFLQSYS